MKKLLSIKKNLKSKLALILVLVLVLSSTTVFANPMSTVTTSTKPSEDEITFIGHSSIGMGGSAQGTELKLVIEPDNKFRLETNKPRGNGSYTITEENGVNKIVFVYTDLVEDKAVEMNGTISTKDISSDDVIIKIENVIYNIVGMGLMKMGEVEFKKEPAIVEVTTNIMYKGKAAFGMQAGSFTAMNLTIMPNNRFMVETTKPRGEGSYEIKVNASGLNAIIFTYDDKTSDGNILTMTGTVSDVDLTKQNVAIEISNATYPLNGMKPLNLGYLKMMVPNDTPSAMLKPSIDKAIEKGIISETMQNSYNISLTREEAAELIINMIEKIEGKTIDEFLSAKSLVINEEKFEDCKNKAVHALEAMGVINGVSDTLFAPHKLVTKEQLAVIIAKTLKNYFNYTTDVNELAAMDAAKISTWAKQSVSTVLNLKIEDNALMSVERGLFNPLNHISREQAYLIILNLSNYK
jgi:hypothetical protein